MTHFYERNIVEIKTEYMVYLTDVLVPLIYEGIQSTYNYATEQCDKLEGLSRENPNIKNPGVIKIFQSCLKEIPSLSANAIEIETKRIKEFSRCSEWFDDLVKAVVKSYIVLLTYNASGKTCKLVNEKYHEKINVNEFIHKCYIECSVTFFNNPELFWTGHNKETMQTCKSMSYKYIKQSIIDAIHKMLPIKAILQEYLSNDYVVEHIHKHRDEREHVRNLLTSDKQSHHVGDFNPPQPENGFSLLESDKEKGSSNANAMLVESSESIADDDKMDDNIKEHLEKIIADDQLIDKNNENSHHMRSQYQQSDKKSPEKNIPIQPYEQLSPKNIPMKPYEQISPKNENRDINEQQPKQIITQGVVPIQPPQNIVPPQQQMNKEEMLNMIGGNIHNDRVLTDQGIDKYFEEYLNDK